MSAKQRILLAIGMGVLTGTVVFWAYTVLSAGKPTRIPRRQIRRVIVTPTDTQFYHFDSARPANLP